MKALSVEGVGDTLSQAIVKSRDFNTGVRRDTC